MYGTGYVSWAIIYMYEKGYVSWEIIYMYGTGYVSWTIIYMYGTEYVSWAIIYMYGTGYVSWAIINMYGTGYVSWAIINRWHKKNTGSTSLLWVRARLYYLLKYSERWMHSSLKWYCTKKQTESFYIILALDVLVLEIAMDK